MRLVEYRTIREALLETPRDVPISFPLDRVALRKKFDELPKKHGDFLTEAASKELLNAYGIPVAEPVAAATAEEAARAAEKIGFPVVVKLLSETLTHKTEVGGVVLNLTTPQQVRDAFEQVVSNVAKLRPDADIQGVTVQRMVTAASGVELILGVKRDPVFGPVIMVGAGGVAAEVSQDIALELPPLNEPLARRMLHSLRIWPLLSGFRGRPPVAIDQVIETLIRLSYLAAHLPEIAELDVNPLLAAPGEVIALDARIRIADPAPLPTSRPHAHLAICPYPQEYTQTVQLRDGEEITFRAIRPEDEPAWKELIRRSSTESLAKRFRYLFKEATHEMAVRYCFVDYDRELSLCAEAIVDGEPMLVGVAQLVADPDHEAADYAVLVIDSYQGRGLGTLLTEKSLEIARRWGLRRITGETTADNFAMIRIFSRAGFHVYVDGSDPTVILARLTLAPETSGPKPQEQAAKESTVKI